MAAHTFEAEVAPGGGVGSTCFLEIPADVIAALEKGKRPPVSVTVNGYTYRTTVAVYDGTFMVPVRREVREAAGITHGAVVPVTVQLDDAPRVVELPPDLAAALAGDPVAQQAYDRLSFSHRKEYADWVGSAKREEPRRKRVEGALAMLRDGTKTPTGP